MSQSVPSSPLKISADWLSHALSEQSLHPVRVEKVEIQAGTQWNVAETAFVSVSYQSASTSLPTRLFIKIRANPDPLADIFPGEQAFYTSAVGANLPIAPCLASLRDPTTGATCIILEDLSTTHDATPWPLPPNLSRCHQAVRSLAEFHACWVQDNPEGALHRENALNKLFLEMLPHFLEHLGDRLSSDRAELLTQVCLKIPGLKAERYKSGQPITRIHGDAHFWNILYPKDSENSAALLIDFEDWRIDFAGLDLALLIAMHWYPQRRALHEKKSAQSLSKRLQRL